MKFRVAASVLLTAALVSVMTACAFITPQQTTRSYTPSDGVNGAAGDVEIRNMVVVLSEDGTTASLVGALVNTSDSSASVTVEYATATGTESQQIEVPAGLLSLRTGATTTAASGQAAQQVVLSDVDPAAGGLFPVSFLAGSASESLKLPVLTGSLTEYASLVPTPTPTPTKTKKTKDEATESPTPTP